MYIYLIPDTNTDILVCFYSFSISTDKNVCATFYIKYEHSRQKSSPSLTAS